jgi:DNA-binding SARP family transcriptional activator
MSVTHLVPRLLDTASPHSGDGPDCRTFGEFAVLINGNPVDIGGPKQRLLLALLICRANSFVHVDELTDALWACHPPRTARKNLQVYVCGLRKVFGDRLTHNGWGYRLRIGPAECDLLRFEELIRSGRQLVHDGDTGVAVELLERAIALWHARPLAEFHNESWLAPELDRRHELLLSALEDWAEVRIEQGRHRAVLDVLEAHVRTQLLRERLGVAWMRALAGAGRAGEALAHYELIRRALGAELGLTPGPALVRAQGRLLRGEGIARSVVGVPATAPGDQLPRNVHDFVGRTVEIERVAENFADACPDVVVVSGPVGIGKSAFAVHMARLLEQRFPDGRLVLDLAAEDGHAKPVETVLRELLDMIGFDQHDQHDPPHRALGRWRSWIAGRRLLLLLDNALDEVVVRTLLPGGGCSGVIVISRLRLSGLESVLRVDLSPLTGTQSVELLGRIIGRGRTWADLATTGRILDYCECLPLAVRITGAKLATLRHVRLADYLDRLRAARCPLAEMAAGELVLRERYESFHRGLSRCQQVSYHRVVASLSPPFGHHQVIDALAEGADPAERALESLLECNLLTVPDCEVSTQTARYGMSAFAYRYAQLLASA